MNGDGPLDFDATINQREFNQALDQMINRIRGVGDQAEKEGSKIDQSFRNAAAAVTAYFSAGFAKNMIQEIGQVRGEFQQLEIALETILKNKQQSDALMKDIVRFAAKTPFDLKGVAAGAKQLLAYGTEVDDIIPTMRRLGDVAAGLSIPFGDLVYLYGTSATQGRIMTKDLMQFANRGIPIIEELSKTLNVSKAEILDLASEGALSFEMLQEVIVNLTESTGMFGGMMEKQAASITGLASNLGDAWDQMLNSIGESNQSTFEDAIKAAIEVVENYEAVLDILKVIVATYGSYRAMVILNTIAMQGYTNALGLAVIKQNLLNLAQKASPWGLALAGVTALIGGLWAYNRATDRTKDALSSINEETTKEIASLNAVFKSLKDAKEGTDKRKDAIDVINTRYSKYLDNLLTEKSTIEDIEKAQNKATNALIANIAVKQSSTALEEVLGKVNEKFNSEFSSFLDGFSEKFGADRIGSFINALNDAVDKEIKSSGGQIKRGTLEYSQYAKDVYDEFVKDLSQSTGYLKYSFDDFKDSFLDFAQAKAGQLPMIEQLKAIITNYQDLIAVVNEDPEPDADPLDKTKKTFAQNLSEIRQMYENYYNWAKNYGKESADEQFKNLVSGGQSFLEYLDKEISKYEAKTTKTGQDRDNLSVLLSTKDDLLGNKSQIDAIKEQIDSAKDQYKDLIDYIEFLKKTIDTQGQWDGSEQGLQKMNLLYQELSKAEKDFFKQSNETYQKLIETAGTYSQKRKKIDQDYFNAVKALDEKTLGSEKFKEAIEAAQKLRQEQINILTDEEIKGSEAFKKLSDDLSSLTRGEALKYLNILKEQLSTLKDQPKVYASLKKFIENTSAELKSIDSTKLADGLTTAANSIGDIAQNLEGVNENFKQILSTIGQLVGQLGNVVNGLKIDPNTGGFANALGAAQGIVGLTFSVANALDKQFGVQAGIAKREKERLSYQQQQLFQSQRLSEELQEQLRLISTMATGQQFAPSTNALEQAIAENRAALDDLRFVDQKVPKAVQGKVKISLADMIDMSGIQDEAEVLQRALSEGFISQSDYDMAVAYLEAIKDAEREIADIERQQNEYLTGTTVNGLADGIVSMFREGKNSADDFASYFEDIMRDAMLQSIKMKALEAPLQQFFEQFSTATADGLDTSEIEDLRAVYNAIINDANQQFAALQSILGDTNALQADTSLTGAIKGVSQETASLIAGQMNAIRMNQAQSLVALNSILSQLSGIEYNTRNNVFIRRIYELLQTKTDDNSNNIRANGGF